MLGRRPRHNPIPRPEGLDYVELELVGEPVITSTAPTPRVKGRFAFSSTRSRQASWRARFPPDVEPGPVACIAGDDQLMISLGPPQVIGPGYEIIVDPAMPMRLERFKGRMPARIFAGYVR